MSPRQTLFALTLLLASLSAGCPAEPEAPADTNAPDVVADVAVADAGAETAVSEIFEDSATAPDADAATQDAADVDGSADVAAPQTYTLVNNAMWAEVLLDADPWHTANDPTPDICPTEDITAEVTPDGTVLEIETTFCAWATLKQPLLFDVPAGAEVTLVIRHDEIIDGETDYLLAVAWGPEATEIWSETVEVFAQFNEFTFTFTAEAAREAGDDVFFHLENHGVNTWNFVSLEATY